MNAKQFFNKYKIWIIVGSILFVIAYSKGMFNDIPLFSGSLIGGGTLGNLGSVSIFLGIALIIGGILMSAAGLPMVGIIMLGVGVLSMFSGAFLSYMDSLVRSNPLAALIIGIVALVIISSLFGGGSRSPPPRKFIYEKIGGSR